MFEIKNNFLIIPENLNFTSITLIDENTLILSNLKQNINLSMTSQNRKVYRIILANTYSVEKVGNKIKLPKQILDKINFSEYDISFTQNNNIIIKVIRDHSTIGIVVTTDGSIGEIERKCYEEKEEQVIKELKEIGKPFIVLLNSTHPMLPETERLASSIKSKYDVPTIPISIETMTEKDSYNILKEALYEFPVMSINVNMPEWIACLSPNHWLKKVYMDKVRECVCDVDKLRDIEKITEHFTSNEYIEKAYLSDVNTETGVVTINLRSPDTLYNEVLNEIIGVKIGSRADMINLFQELSEAKMEYDHIKSALKMTKIRWL